MHTHYINHNLCLPVSTNRGHRCVLHRNPLNDLIYCITLNYILTLVVITEICLKNTTPTILFKLAFSELTEKKNDKASNRLLIESLSKQLVVIKVGVPRLKHYFCTRLARTEERFQPVSNIEICLRTYNTQPPLKSVNVCALK